MRNQRRRRPVRRHRRSTIEAFLPVIMACLLITIIAVPVVWSMSKKKSKNNEDNNQNSEQQEKPTIVSDEIEKIMKEAERMAAMYDYDRAVKKIDEAIALDPENEEVLGKKVKYTRNKTKLVPYTGEVAHVFFHSLIVNPKLCFDGYPDPSQVDGYNKWMTTLEEFKKMMSQMRTNGYVLVRFEDFCEEVKGENGKVTYKQKAIMLPEGKKPFVLSQDDVNYYEYMEHDGFASKFVFDEDGNVKNLYIDENGKEHIGDYDMVPALDTFLDEHPDFSYKGAKGYIGETGYEGSLGYDTHKPDSKTFKEDQEMVKALAKALREDGWEFASHSYGHGHMNSQSLEKVKQDANSWEKEVGSLIGPVDVYLYPYGEGAPADSDKFKYLQAKGFKYFCGVGAKTFNLFKDGYVFMDRSNLDGYAMHNRSELLSKFFNSKKVWDKSRPKFNQ